MTCTRSTGKRHCIQQSQLGRRVAGVLRELKRFAALRTGRSWQQGCRSQDGAHHTRRSRRRSSLVHERSGLRPHLRPAPGLRRVSGAVAVCQRRAVVRGVEHRREPHHVPAHVLRHEVIRHRHHRRVAGAAVDAGDDGGHGHVDVDREPVPLLRPRRVLLHPLQRRRAAVHHDADTVNQTRGLPRPGRVRPPVVYHEVLRRHLRVAVHRLRHDEPRLQRTQLLRERKQVLRRSSARPGVALDVQVDPVDAEVRPPRHLLRHRLRRALRRQERPLLLRVRLPADADHERHILPHAPLLSLALRELLHRGRQRRQQRGVHERHEHHVGPVQLVVVQVRLPHVRARVVLHRVVREQAVEPAHPLGESCGDRNLRKHRAHDNGRLHHRQGGGVLCVSMKYRYCSFY
eukprot:Rhum_TRINITY_DN15311_c0_g1::Rhum_TRINITY_DN15311_c0_g1_i2::g.151018::m.151018